MKYITTITFIVLGVLNTIAQSNNNGKLDTITEFTTIVTTPFIMPDGTSLSTDIYLPIIGDSVTTTINISGTNYNIQLIPKGTQLFVYDSTGNTPNQNMYKLPMVFTRTPYSKGSYDEFGIYLNILGYAYALQDMRGRYESEGVYLPMYSDGWNKDAYHPNEKHVLDVTNVSNPLNGNYHQDGKYSIDFIKDSLERQYDIDANGTIDTTDRIYNGSIVMFGASALGNTQYQAASAIKNDVNQDGLKGLIPIVATNEHFNCVLQHNGVFRQALVQGWLTGQLEHNIDTIPSDNDIQNNVHSIFDYGNISGDTVIARAVDYMTSIPDANGYSGMYPNHLKRTDPDASFAPINSLGNSDINGSYNRYTNLEIPIYHLTGWWDIFIDGQIDTYNNVMKNTSQQTKLNQKIVIGPWTHGTIAQDSVADIVYPSSVFDVKIANTTSLSMDIGSLVDGEMVDWLRYLLNYNTNNYIGEPKVHIPESQVWQNMGASQVRVPSSSYFLTYAEFVNYISGHGGLNNIPIQIKQGANVSNHNINIPADTSLQQPGSQPVSDPISSPVNYEQIPNVRFYVPGPVNDGEPQNTGVGNYWKATSSFPLPNGIRNYTMYLHSNHTLDTILPQTTEPSLNYNHDPDNPVYTLGGGNLGIPTPQQNRVNAGPMNYADTNYASYTMNRPDVLKFESAAIQDSLCIIGIPTAKIYASSTPLSGPQGPTDTDFFVRILDVYPDGREYFVVEGAVNARARNYAKQLANGIEDINIPYTNITAGQDYEFEFKLLPIAYTFGHNHKIKVLISSSNWPRYQSNPNVPIETGEFFRRTPGDGKTYKFNSTTYSARVAQQDIYFSPSQPTQITLPLYDGVTGVSITEKKENNSWYVYPNPAYNNITILTNYSKNYSIKVLSITGQTVLNTNGNSMKKELDISRLSKGVYVIKIRTEEGQLITNKIVKK